MIADDAIKDEVDHLLCLYDRGTKLVRLKDGKPVWIQHYETNLRVVVYDYDCGYLSMPIEALWAEFKEAT